MFRAIVLEDSVGGQFAAWTAQHSAVGQLLPRGVRLNTHELCVTQAVKVAASATKHAALV